MGGIEGYLAAEKSENESQKIKPIIPRDDQKPVLEYKKGSMAISAVPGAGKTTILLALIMKLLNMNCPNCGSNLAEKGKFCPHCGSSIPEDILFKFDMKQEIIDYGRVAEAQTKKEVSKEHTKRGNILVRIVLILVLGFLALFVLSMIADNNQRSSTQSYSSTSSLFAEERAAHAKEIERLQKLEDEILEDIRNERYDQALTKTALLYYTTGYSNSAKEEWDAKRESLREQLNKLIK